MMDKAGNGHLLTVLSYPGAGHLIEPPYTPHTRASNFKLIEAKTTGKLFTCLFVGFLITSIVSKTI